MGSNERLLDANAVARLCDRDASLFSDDPAVQATVTNRLGWTDLATRPTPALEQVKRIAEKAVSDGVTDVVLLGMGGSSLASLVLARVLGETAAKLHVLDTTSPVTITRALEQTDPATTLHLVASKSGGTIEPNSLYAIFRKRADEALGAEAAGQRFVAVTDPGTSLASLAEKTGFADVVSAPADVGGRFSALTVFGLLPAALIGADVDLLLSRGATAEEKCGASTEENPAVELAVFIAEAHEAGHDKLTLAASRGLRSFGLWVEQLVAESLGKHGTGVVPVVDLSDGVPQGMGVDRAIVVVRDTGDRRLAEWAQSQRGRQPVYEIVFDDAYDLAEEFVRWEHAVALCGFLLGVNPFDEPNVAEAKAATSDVLEQRGTAPEPQESVDDVYLTFAGGLEAPGHAERYIATAVGHALASIRERDYLAILAYLPDDDELLAPLVEAIPALSAGTGAATCFELGPRYLHSTGQLHKGGPNSGVFVLVTTRDETDLEVPGQWWGLRALHSAQAEGDLVTLAAHGRRVLRIDLPDASAESIATLASAILDGAGVVHEV